MRIAIIAIAGLSSLFLTPAANAESFGEMCQRVSDEWGTVGDIDAQCACLADKAAGDSAFNDELTSLADAYSSDQEAYDAASDSTKAALDACSVNS
jgi:hypothetical protein